MCAGIMDERRLGLVRSDSSWSDGRSEGGIVLADTVWNNCEKRGERDDDPVDVNDGLELEVCSWERPVGGISWVSPPTGWASATVSRA